MISIIDCGSQLTQNIARRIRENSVFSEIIPYHTSLDEIVRADTEAIIASGGQFSVYDEKAPIYDYRVLESGKPFLGICYGQQSLVHILRGKVEPTDEREYGRTNIRIEKESPLFKGIPEDTFDVWMSHGDIVTELPPGFEIVARSRNGHIAAIQNLEKKMFAVQFHPEVDHTQYGRQILENFIELSGANRNWTASNFIDMSIARIRDKVGKGIAIAGVSGGVDSTTLAALMRKALGDRFYAVTVDNGLLRKDEGPEVAASLARMGVQFVYVDASQRFLDKLRKVVDPDEKRNIIGHEFIDVFETQARRISGVKYLGQGTLYPDVIESAPIYGVSSKIKRHHNVGGLPDRMELQLIEPFRDMFKDEVRAVAEELGLPKEVVWRHPFPGPGLAVRIIGDVTPEKLRIVRAADKIYMDELHSRGIYYNISQAFAALTNSQAVGVMGDGGTYEGIIVLRAVTTNDFMTSDIYNFRWRDLQSIGSRIINEVKGVNRVMYDISQKPPSTIELE